MPPLQPSPSQLTKSFLENGRTPGKASASMTQGGIPYPGSNKLLTPAPANADLGSRDDGSRNWISAMWVPGKAHTWESQSTARRPLDFFSPSHFAWPPPVKQNPKAISWIQIRTYLSFLSYGPTIITPSPPLAPPVLSISFLPSPLTTTGKETTPLQ